MQFQNTEQRNYDHFWNNTIVATHQQILKLFSQLKLNNHRSIFRPETTQEKIQLLDNLLKRYLDNATCFLQGLNGFINDETVSDQDYINDYLEQSIKIISSDLKNYQEKMGAFSDDNLKQTSDHIKKCLTVLNPQADIMGHVENYLDDLTSRYEAEAQQLDDLNINTPSWLETMILPLR